MANGNTTRMSTPVATVVNGSVALLMRQAECPAIERVPLMLKSDALRLLRGESPNVMNYSIVEVRQENTARLMIRFGTFRRPQHEITSDAVYEVGLIDPSLETRAVETGTITILGDVLSSSEPTGKGLGLKILSGLFSGDIQA